MSTAPIPQDPPKATPLPANDDWEVRLEQILGDDPHCQHLLTVGEHTQAVGGHTGARLRELREMAAVIRDRYGIDRATIESRVATLINYQEGQRPSYSSVRHRKVIMFAALLAEIHEVFFF